MSCMREARSNLKERDKLICITLMKTYLLDSHKRRNKAVVIQLVLV